MPAMGDANMPERGCASESDVVSDMRPAMGDTKVLMGSIMMLAKTDMKLLMASVQAGTTYNMRMRVLRPVATRGR